MLKESFFLPSYKNGHFELQLVERCSAEFAASKQLPWPIAVLHFIWVHHLIRMDVPKTGKIFPKSWIYDYAWMTWRSQQNVECEVEKKFKVHWVDWQVYHTKINFCLLFAKSRARRQEAGQRHLWGFVSVDKFLSTLRQVGCIWCGELMTAIWQTFWLSKQTCLSFVPSATYALLRTLTTFLYKLETLAYLHIVVPMDKTRQ